MIDTHSMATPVTFLLAISILLGCAHSHQYTEASHAPQDTPAMAAVLGWDGDRDAAIAHEDGSFEIRDGKNFTAGFAIYQHLKPKSLSWENEEGYLPSLVTRFSSLDIHVTITNFGDELTLNGNRFVVIYSRILIENKGRYATEISPGASRELVSLVDFPASAYLRPNESIAFDYAVAIDRFANSYSWPTSLALKKAGSWDFHHEHMKKYWNQKLSEIVDLEIPDSRLNNAYKAGFIYTHIIKDGSGLNVGENGYDKVYDHDSIEILSSLLTIGYFSEAKTLLASLPFSYQYRDANWRFSIPWAIYLLKTGDSAHIEKNWPKISAAAHTIEKERTGPHGIMIKSNDVDSHGYWTVDNWSAMTGLLAYDFLAKTLGKYDESIWAETQYASLSKVVNETLVQTMQSEKLNYIPASVLVPNTENKCRVPDYAVWASHLRFGHWLWDGFLLGGSQEGLANDLGGLVDSTYDYGFERLRKAGRPAHTFGGFPGFSTAANAGYGEAALRGSRYRSEGIRAYQFLIKEAQSGPYSWWESIDDPVPTVWEGSHPRGGTGSCPHNWGQASNTKVLVDSMIAEFYDGRLTIGRGIPTEWLTSGVGASNVPIHDGGRIAFHLKAKKRYIYFTISGSLPRGEIYLDLPLFLENKIISTSTGAVKSNRIVFPPNTRYAEIKMSEAIPSDVK